MAQDYKSFIKKIIFWTLLTSALYHIYLVIHPFTPLSNYHISILSLTQVKRTVHISLLIFAGFLIIFDKSESSKFNFFTLIFLIMSFIPLYSFWEINLPLIYKIYAGIIWTVTISSAIFTKKLNFLNILNAVLILLPTFYLIINYENLIYRAILPEPFDLVMSFLEIYLLITITYRVIGAALPILILLFIIYNIYGNLIPGQFSGPGFSFDMILGKLYCETEAGLFGVITGVSLKYLVYFTILGGVVTELGFGKIISNIALALVGKHPASPGRVSCILAVFMGLFSGSGAADTQFVATITRDLYQRAKYNIYIASGIVATVGSIAYITPPIMGSISFLMVELLAIPYTHIIVMAVGPMLIYLFGIWLYNEFYVRKDKIKTIELPINVDKEYLLKHSFVFLPIILILSMIYLGFAVNISVVLSTFLFIILAYIAPSMRPHYSKVTLGFANGFKSLIHIGVAVGAANIVMTMMVTSGVAAKFSVLLSELSKGNLFFALIFTAIFSIILGMGIPPIATYVLTSALTAPAILKLAVAAGIPENAALLSTHMFLFYYAVLSEVTPPVGLSVYASSSVFGTNPIKTGIYSAIVALPKYLIGLSFICSYFGTALLIIPFLEQNSNLQGVFTIAIKFILTGVATLFLIIGTTGFFRVNLTKTERIIMTTLGVAMFYPSLYLNLILLLPGIFIIVKKIIQNRKVEDLSNVDS